MRTKWLKGGALLVAIVASAPAAAQELTGEIIGRAVTLDRQGRAEEAYRLLQPLAAERAGDPDFDYALALAAIDSGRPGEGIVALQRVLSIQPTNAQARAELARAYAQGGDVDTAKREFDTVVDDPSLPDPVRQRFNRLVRALAAEQRAGGTDVTGFVEASGGYDSNINSATALSSITLPLFAGLGAATLSGNARRVDAGFVLAEGGVSVTSGVSRQTRLFASLLGSIRENVDDDIFDQATATATAGIGHTLANRDVLSASGQFQQLWLGYDRYRQAYGATGQYTHRLTGGRALTLSAQWTRLDYRTDPLRDADRFAGVASYIGRTAVFSLGGGHEQVRDRAADDLSNLFANGRVSVERPVGGTFSIVAGAGAEYRHHDATDILFLRRREEVQLDASFGLKALVAPSVYVRPAVSYLRNVSNIDLYEYDRVVVSVGVRTEF